MISTLLLILLVYHSNAQSQKTTVWTETFTSGVVPTTCQCQNWIDFWQFWIGDPSQVVSITLGGSQTSDIYRCSGSAAQFVAFTLATPPPYEFSEVTCDSAVWYTYGTQSGTIGAELIVAPATTICSSFPIVRPCSEDVNWGGISSTNCSIPSQSLTVTVVSNIPTVTVPPATVTWTDSFSYHTPAASVKCTKWKQFWQNSVPRTGSLSVTLSSSINGGVSATCSGPGVNLLVTALFTPTSNGQYHCNEGTVWYFNGIYVDYPYPNTSAIQIGAQPYGCTADLSLRPCWDQSALGNWGGFGGENCAAPSQNFTATVTIGKPVNSTNRCWQQLNVKIVSGIFTISCDTIKLQCNSNYNASGYEPNSTGFYSCTDAVWIPAVPTCNGGSQQTTTSTRPTPSTPVAQLRNNQTPIPTSHPVATVPKNANKPVWQRPEPASGPRATVKNSPTVFDKNPWLLWTLTGIAIVVTVAICICCRFCCGSAKISEKEEGKEDKFAGYRLGRPPISVGPPKPI